MPISHFMQRSLKLFEGSFEAVIFRSFLSELPLQLDTVLPAGGRGIMVGMVPVLLYGRPCHIHNPDSSLYHFKRVGMRALYYHGLRKLGLICVTFVSDV